MLNVHTASSEFSQIKTERGPERSRRINKHRTLFLLKCCLTSTETVGLLGTGAQDVHLDFHTAPELWPGGKALKQKDLGWILSPARLSLQKVVVCGYRLCDFAPHN